MEVAGNVILPELQVSVPGFSHCLMVTVLLTTSDKCSREASMRAAQTLTIWMKLQPQQADSEVLATHATKASTDAVTLCSLLAYRGCHSRHPAAPTIHLPAPAALMLCVHQIFYTTSSAALAA